MKRRFYAEKNGIGYNGTVKIMFSSRKERDEYVKKTDYANAIPAAEVNRPDYEYINGELKELYYGI